MNNSNKKGVTKILENLTKLAVTKHKNVPASMLNDLLLIFGGYRPQNQAVFPQNDAVVAKVVRISIYSL